MPELYVPLDVNWPDHPKVMEAGLEGSGLHAQALCMAKRLGTDGLIAKTQLRRLGASDELIDRLLDLGLFDHIDKRTIQVHGWLDRNPSAAELDSRRQAKGLAGKEGNHKRWGHAGEVVDCAVCNPTDNPLSHGAVPPESACDPMGSLSEVRERVKGERGTAIAASDRAAALVDEQHAELGAYLARLQAAHPASSIDDALTHLEGLGTRYRYPRLLTAALTAALVRDAGQRTANAITATAERLASIPDHIDPDEHRSGFDQARAALSGAETA